MKGLMSILLFHTLFYSSLLVTLVYCAWACHLRKRNCSKTGAYEGKHESSESSCRQRITTLVVFGLFPPSRSCSFVYEGYRPKHSIFFQ